MLLRSAWGSAANSESAAAMSLSRPFMTDPLSFELQAKSEPVGKSPLNFKREERHRTPHREQGDQRKQSSASKAEADKDGSGRVRFNSGVDRSRRRGCGLRRLR